MKNWTVKFKSLKTGKKSLFDYMSYLNNNEHKNHTKDGHNILEIGGRDFKHFYIELCKLNDERNRNNIMNGKGGRPSVKIAQSITLNLPFHLNGGDFEEVGSKVLSRFFTELNKMENLRISKEQFIQIKKDLLYFNVHTQPKGSMTQFNFLLPQYLNGQSIDLTKKKYSFLFKSISNEVMRELGYDIDKYQLQEVQHTQNKYNQSDYKIKKIETIIDTLTDRFSDIDNILEDYEKEFKRIKTYMGRMEKHKENGNTEQYKKNEKLVEENLQKIEKSLQGKKTNLEMLKSSTPPPFR